MDKILYADDLALQAEDCRSLEALVERWREEFEKHGLRINVGKTEVMCVNNNNEDMRVETRGVRLKQVNSFVYLGSALMENGKMENEINRRIQAGVNAWRKVEGVMVDRNIVEKLREECLKLV